MNSWPIDSMQRWSGDFRHVPIASSFLPTSPKAHNPSLALALSQNDQPRLTNQKSKKKTYPSTLHPEPSLQTPAHWARYPYFPVPLVSDPVCVEETASPPRKTAWGSSLWWVAYCLACLSDGGLLFWCLFLIALVVVVNSMWMRTYV